MPSPSLLLPADRRELVTRFFEMRADAVDRGDATVRDGLCFLQREVLTGGFDARGPNADLALVAETIATVAWSDMSSAFSLWAHRMVLEYLACAPAGTAAIERLLPRLLQIDLLGSTALAGAIAHVLGEVPLPITGRCDGDQIVLNGRITWASNLLQPDFVVVTAAALDDGRRVIIALPGATPGVDVAPYPRLLALQSTWSSSMQLVGARVGQDCVITDQFDAFISRIRPPFLVLQTCFCWGLAARALDQTRGSLRGMTELFRPDLDAADASLGRQAEQLRAAIDGLLEMPIRELVRLRLDAARLATEAVALEAKVIGGRGYVTTSPTARRLREAAFLPIQSPTEGQLRWELSRSE